MASARVDGQPNNYREKMAAYGVHDMSALERKQQQEQVADVKGVGAKDPQGGGGQGQLWGYPIINR